MARMRKYPVFFINSRSLMSAGAVREALRVAIALSGWFRTGAACMRRAYRAGGFQRVVISGGGHGNTESPSVARAMADFMLAACREKPWREVGSDNLSRKREIGNAHGS